MRDLFFKKLYNLGVCSLLRMSKKNSITVLSLHRISEERDFFFNPIKPSTFVKLLEYCCKYYEITTFEDVHKPSAKAKLILSFDDGYYDFIEFAMPIMKKMGIPSNHNIVNSCANSNEVIWTQKLNDVFNFMKINDITNDNIIKTTSTFQGNWMQYYLSFFYEMLRTEKEQRVAIINQLVNHYNIISNCRMMNWDDIIYCSQNDVEIGSHTYNHDSLISIKKSINYDIEIHRSITEISEKIKKNVSILALPNGKYSNEVLEYVNCTEIKFLLLVDDKINKSITDPNLNLVSRIGLADDSPWESILRMELFHSKLKKIV